MDKKKVLRIAPYAFLAAMGILTILFFLDIKFVVGLNIIAWDMLAVAVWIFVRLYKWAGQENAKSRSFAVTAITLMGAMVLAIVIFGVLPQYIEKIEPQTHRTFVVEYTSNMMNRGRAKLYERFGPMLLACDVDEYIGEFLLERSEDRQIYVSEDGKSIVVAYFFLRPVFVVPLE